MLTLRVYRYAALLTYYFTVEESSPNLFLCAHSDDNGNSFRVYPVDSNRVPDLGTMVRETYREALPLAMRTAINDRVAGALWRVLQYPGLENQKPTATLCLFNTLTATHESFPYGSSTTAIGDGRTFTEERPELVAQVLSRTCRAGGMDGGSTRAWTLAGGYCKGSYDLLDGGGVFGLVEEKAKRRKRR